MRSARLFAVLAAPLVLAPPAAGTSRTLPAAPDQLHAFLLRADEPLSHTFGRTPSFAWLPALGAERYEFELANSPTFNEGSIVWSDATLKTPAASIPWSLPWMTGSPYALYAHVRAWTADGAGPWSSSFGFNMRWASLPQPVPTYPGLLSWSTVTGATCSDVTSSAAQPEAHRLTPAFAFTGNQALDGTATELFRAYVFTDSDCVNVVFRSAIIGSPAYAPRTTGPAKLPVSQPEVDAA